MIAACMGAAGVLASDSATVPAGTASSTTAPGVGTMPALPNGTVAAPSGQPGTVNGQPGAPINGQPGMGKGQPGVTGTAVASPTTPQNGQQTTQQNGQSTTTQGTVGVQNATDLIAAVQKDRDSLNGKVDVSLVNQLLDKAGALRDQAQNLRNSNVTQAQAYARASMDASMAAENLLTAQLTSYGLPSQQARVSNELVNAYYAIQNRTNQAKNSTNVDVSFSIATAQSLYKSAYDLYNKGLYAQASRTADVARQVGRIVDDIYAANGVTSAPVGPGSAGAHGRPAPAGPRAGGPAPIGPDPGGPAGLAPGMLGTQQTPVTVPQPNF